MDNVLFAEKVRREFGPKASAAVANAFVRATKLFADAIPYVEVTRVIEAEARRKGLGDREVRLCLVAAHAQFEGWDGAFDFFLEDEFKQVDEGQEALVSWVRAGNWL